jgi:3-isopropylmalate dehydrogenase
MTKIGIMMGDDIGYEVVPECVKVMRAATARTGFEIAWETYPIGKEGHDLHGDTTPAVTVEGLQTCDGFIMGPIGHSAYPRNDPTWIMPPIRKLFDLFASVKPVKSYPGITSVHEDVDIVFLREVTEGMQSWDTAANGNAEYMPNKDTAIGARVITREGSRRVAKEAFEIAMTRPRKKVAAAHKEGVYRMTCGLFVEECRALAEQYPDVEYTEFNIDTICAHLVMEPQQFDVIVTTNQFGDILTDLGAGLVGGLGLAPGLCVGHTQAMPQATHGSAPDIAGQNIANPYALIMSGQMLLDWLGRKRKEPKATEAAALIATAMDQVISEAKHLTRDLGGTASTTEMGDAVVDAIG